MKHTKKEIIEKFVGHAPDDGRHDGKVINTVL